MRLSFKVLLGLWIGLFVIIGGLLFNAYSNLKPETFIALLTEQVQRNYPGAKLEVGKVDYGFSLDFNLNLQNIQLRRSGKLLASVGKVELKVPWWLLIINRGNAQINLSKLDIYVDHHENHEVKVPGGPSSPHLIKVSLPNYLADARYTLRAKEVSIRDIHNERRFFTLSKLLVREFQYGKNSAFELNIPIEITHNQVRYSSDLWLFGDITPDTDQWTLNYRGEFRTRENNDKFQIEDMVIGGKSTFRPETMSVSSQIELEIEKTPVGRGTLSANTDALSVHFNFNKIPVSYFGFIYDEIKNPYLSKLEGDGQGHLKFDKSFNSSVATVEGKIAFDGALQVSNTLSLPGNWQLSFRDSRWEVSFMSPKGEASFFRRSTLNAKGQYTEELGFTNLDLGAVIGTVIPLSRLISDDSASFHLSSVSFKKCTLGDKVLDGNFRYGVTPDQKFYMADLMDGAGAFKLAYNFKTLQHQLDAEWNKFSWRPAFVFLAPYFQQATMVLDGKLEGRWKDQWDEGQWLGHLSGTEIQGAQGRFPDLIQKTLAYFEINPQNFKHQALHFSVKNNVVTLNSLSLENEDSGKITGSLTTLPKHKSFLTLAYPKNKKWKPVKKDVLEPYWK